MAAGAEPAKSPPPAGPPPLPKAPAPIQVRIDGEAVEFEVPPMEKDRHIVVPMQAIFHRLGAHVNFDRYTRTVKAIKGTRVIVLELGKPVAHIGLKTVPLDVPPFMEKDSVMVPLRFVGEALGAHVSWSPEQRTVFIQSKGGKRVAVGPAKTSKQPDARSSPSPSPSPSPSATPPPAPPDTAPVGIKEFYHNAKGPLQPGDTLVVTLIGTQHGHASFFIEGAAENVAMKEISPGTYSGDYKFPATTVLQNAKVYGTLQVGKERAPLAVTATGVTVEPPRPHLDKMEPPAGSVTSVTAPRVTAFFEMAGGVLDPKTLKIKINTVDVTAKAYVTAEFFSYTPPAPLSAGKVRVDVDGKTKSGQLFQDGWDFEIQPGAAIGSVTHGARAPLKAGEVLNVTMVGTARGKASFDIGSYRVGLPMQESAPGTYVGSYTVTASDRVDAAPIIVHLQVSGFPTAAAQAPQPVTMGSGPPPAASDVPLVVIAPKPEGTVASKFEVRGETHPGSHVTVLVTTHVPVFGEQAVTKGEAVADATGKFVCPIKVPLSKLGTIPIQYTITVAAVTPSGKASRPVQIIVQGGSAKP